MKEMIDIYSNAREKIGAQDRATPIPSGANKISVHVWIKNKNGEYLLQQRVSTAHKFPDMWRQTGVVHKWGNHVGNVVPVNAVKNLESMLIKPRRHGLELLNAHLILWMFGWLNKILI